MSNTMPGAGGCGTPCPTCEPQTPLRNHYFFGKLMDVPDFQVEQDYVVEKLKRHHARLHGTGVICGLEVTAHPNPACRDRYLLISPGAALDCCGNEVLVIAPETIDLTAFPALAGLIAEPDGADHRLQLCIRYRECPTEEVPVLYDACGCDDTRCAPNRILETYGFELLLDPDLPAAPPTAPLAPELAWEATVVLGEARALVLDADTDRAYLAADLSGGTNGTIQQYRLGTLAPVAGHTTATRVLDLALNGDGTRLVAAVAGAAAADPTQLLLLDTTTPAVFAGPELADLDLTGSQAPTSVRLVGRGGPDLAALVVQGANSRVSRLEITAGTALTAVDDLVITGLAPVAWALAGDGSTLYLAPATGAIQALDLAALSLTATTPGLAVSSLTAMAVVRSSAPDRIAWTQASATANRLHLARPDGTDPRQADLPDPPVALTVDGVGHYAYVLMQPATGQARVLALDLHRLLAGQPPTLSNLVEVGPGGRSLSLLGDRLWVVYGEGAAVIAIDQTRCADSLDPHDCPDCVTPDCLVLATVANYRPGRRLEDPTDPPGDPLADAAAGIARIDNLTWRRTVPSVADLARALRCLLDQCCTGGEGGGVQGPPGVPGLGIDAVTVATLPCGQSAQAAIAVIAGARTLQLQIPRGCDGTLGTPGLGIDAVTVATLPCGQNAQAAIAVVAGVRTLQLQIPRGCDGSPGLDPDLPHICDISWKHGETLPVAEVQERGLIVAFDTDVRGADLLPDAIRVLVQRRDRASEGAVLCWCDLDLTEGLSSGRLKETCIAESEFTAGLDGDGMATAVRIRPRQLDPLLDANGGRLRLKVLINGDFIRGRHRKTKALRALDADHIPTADPPGSDPDWLRPGDGRVSGDGIEGGTFESWFTVDKG